MNKSNKTKKFNFLFIVLALVTLVFAGCTKIPDCSEKDTTYEKYKLNKETTTCELYKEIEKNICGNGIVESENDETYCNCKKDVVKTHPKYGCDGEVGDYLEKTCSEETETCELMQNNKVILQTKAVEFKNSDVTFRANFVINTPFILNTVDNNVITVNVDYFKNSAASSVKIRNLLVKEISLENTIGINYGTQLYNEQMTSFGQKLKTKQFKIAQTTQYTSKQSLKSKLVISYTKDIYNTKGEITKSEEKIETLVSALGSWILINPNFDVSE
jgi:hypothetical protein